MLTPFRILSMEGPLMLLKSQLWVIKCKVNHTAAGIMPVTACILFKQHDRNLI